MRKNGPTPVNESETAPILRPWSGGWFLDFAHDGNPTGSFKINVALPQFAAVRRRAFLTSSGNFGVAAAWLANKLQVPATILLPKTACATKFQKIKALGGPLVEVSWAQGDTYPEAYEEVKKLAEAAGEPVLEPFKSRAGLTAITEAVRKAAGPLAGVACDLHVPAGGGGLAAGVMGGLLSAGARLHTVRVVEPAAAPCVSAALKEGRPVVVDVSPSRAGALLIHEAGVEPLAALQHLRHFVVELKVEELTEVEIADCAAIASAQDPAHVWEDSSAMGFYKARGRDRRPVILVRSGRNVPDPPA